MYEVLEEIGLSRNESKAYLALLELGSTSAGCIAKKTRLDRANIYDSLEKLKLKGLASHVKIEGVRHYQATGHEALRNSLNEKAMLLESIMPR